MAHIRLTTKKMDIRRFIVNLSIFLIGMAHKVRNQIASQNIHHKLYQHILQHPKTSFHARKCRLHAV